MALYAAQDGAAEAFAVPEGLRLLPDPDGQTAILSTGRAEFRLLWGEGADSLPPLLGVLGVDNVWRGAGRFTLPDGLQITHRQTTVREQGPLQITLEVVYTLVERAALHSAVDGASGRSLFIGKGNLAHAGRRGLGVFPARMGGQLSQRGARLSALDAGRQKRSLDDPGRAG